LKNKKSCTKDFITNYFEYNIGTEEEAAEAYDIAAIKFRGLNAVTNFDMNRYDVKSILESNTLPIGGGAAKRLKEAQAIESSRKREEMIALGSAGFQYGSSSGGSSRLQAFPLMQQQQPFDHQPQQPLLTLQHPEISHQYTQDPSYQSYIQTQLHLHQQSASSNYLHQNSQFYNGYLQNHPALLQGLMNMGPSSSVMENSGGYLGNGLSMAPNSTPGNAVGSADELALVKVDYDMPSASYGGWSGDSVQGSNPNVFSMWND
jgi:AP2-like factor (ANT lineage)